MSAILDFYKGTGGNASGWRIDEVLAWGDEELEDVHDYIQWLFPLPERSMANPFAPVLDARTIAAFHGDEKLRLKLREALDRMLEFYGLEWQGEVIAPGARFSKRASNWLTAGNHNHLRLTRMIRSLRVLGLEGDGQALWHALKQVHASEAGRASISERTFNFWTRATTSTVKGSDS